MGLGKTLSMLTAIALSKEAAGRHCETYFQDQKQLVPAKGTLVVVTSRRKLSGSSCPSVHCPKPLTYKLASEILEVWKNEAERCV